MRTPVEAPKAALLRRRRPALAGLAAVGALCALAVAQPEQAQACRHADDTHATATSEQLEDAVVCVINKKRDARAKQRLDRNRKLAEAAQKHTKTMLRRDCFRHRCPGEKGLGGRIRATGYLRGAESWHYAENLGCAPTPQDMVRAWMNGPAFNRENLLKPKFRDVGAGAKRGRPTACEERAFRGTTFTTYTVVFAFRRG